MEKAAGVRNTAAECSRLWQPPRVTNDELTNKAFVANPFNENEKIYRTGDIAYWQDNGELICLGRADHQVKIRGNRIELGEIETALKKHPNLDEAVVVVDKEGVVKRLLAYIITNDDAVISSEL